MAIVKGFKITRDAEVINPKTGKAKKHYLGNTGYMRVKLHNNKFEYVHRLIAMAFVPNPDNKSQVNHKDGNKLNNKVSNLEWVLPGENMEHAFKQGLTQYHPRGNYPPKKGRHAFLNKICHG